MKIATWNIERLRHCVNLDEIQDICNNLKADILILTETDERVKPQFMYSYHTINPSENSSIPYRRTENRVSIYTNYECVRQYDTFDPYTSVCVELRTEYRNLIVYGTIIGIEGNRRPSFKTDLISQLHDFEKLALNKNLCICGDYNCSFSDNYYFTTDGRKLITDCFEANKIEILTAKASECIDHIAVSQRLISGMALKIDEWNLDKRLSDHKGIAVTMTKQ